MRNGTAFQRQPSAPRTYATAFSSSRIAPTLPGAVPTPAARDGKDAGDPQRMVETYDARAIRDGFKPEHRQSLAVMAARSLLPTPMRADGERQSETFARGNPTLLGAARALMPTPVASEGQKGPITGSISRLVTRGERYSAGDHRSTNGPAPKDQTIGLLNPTWVEWVMGFPTGWTASDASAMP